MTKRLNKTDRIEPFNGEKNLALHCGDETLLTIEAVAAAYPDATTIRVTKRNGQVNVYRPKES